jgi:hypothetical protein
VDFIDPWLSPSPARRRWHGGAMIIDSSAALIEILADGIRGCPKAGSLRYYRPAFYPGG